MSAKTCRVTSLTWFWFFLTVPYFELEIQYKSSTVKKETLFLFNKFSKFWFGGWTKILLPKGLAQILLLTKLTSFSRPF